jgi:tripeptidyl-peptidase-1
MISPKIILALAIFALFACGVSAIVERAGRRTAAPCVAAQTCTSKDWRLTHRADSDDLVRAIIAVKELNLDVLDQIVKETSNIYSPRYGKHLTFEQIGELTRNQVAIDAIESFLLSHGVKTFKKTLNGDFFVIYMTVEQAETILNTQFHRFESKAHQKTIIRALEYTIPSELVEHVELFGDVVSFPLTLRPTPLIQAVQAVPAAAGTVTPALLITNYAIPSVVVKNKATTQAVFEAGQSFSPTDLATFQKNYNVKSNPITNIIGPNKPNICPINPGLCDEANLDVEYLTAMAQGAPTTFWAVAGNGDVFLNWIVAVANTTNPPLVHSISYGSIESEEPANELKQFDQQAQKLGARGITIVVSSGDDGVANFVARNDSSQCGFNPSFPATATNIVAVGATQGPESGKPEITCSSKTGGIVTSGGGFSTVFNQPTFSAAAVNAYFKSGVTLPPAGKYNAAGRGYPDVALLGYNYEIVDGGQTGLVSGTSCSAPVFAGMLSLVNDARATAGKSSLGLVGPALYALAANTTGIFNDVTSGENNCCAADKNPVCCPYGFYAAKGWDPTTGFGSVQVDTLITALVKV